MINCAFDKGDSCRVLKVKVCDGCGFCKTEEKLREGRKRAVKRLSHLPPELREYIKGKYYTGLRAFKE